MKGGGGGGGLEGFGVLCRGGKGGRYLVKFGILLLFSRVWVWSAWAALLHLPYVFKERGTRCSRVLVGHPVNQIIWRCAGSFGNGPERCDMSPEHLVKLFGQQSSCVFFFKCVKPSLFRGAAGVYVVSVRIRGRTDPRPINLFYDGLIIR